MDDNEMTEMTNEDMEEDDDREKELEKQLESINATLSANPFHYQSYVDKISILKELGELDDLREARTKFSESYPLSPELWLDWLRDEQKLVGTEEEREKVYNLFDSAVQDYQSVELWLEYCSFALSGLSSAPSSVQTVRSVFERAVSAVGIHVLKGSLVWGAYRDFETAVISMKATDDDDDDDDDDDGDKNDNNETNDKYKRLFKVFQRQLSLPLLNMEKTWDEFNDLAEFKDRSASVSSIYTAALKRLRDRREDFENELLRLDDDDGEEEETKFSKYAEYLEFEKSSDTSNPAMIQNLFERRITDHCLNPRSWMEYLDYLDTELKIGTISIPVYQRAVRNVPWVGAIWTRYLRALERYESNHSDINLVLEEALKSSDPSQYGEVWLQYLGYFRRCRRDPNKKEEFKTLVERAIDHINSNPGSDPELKVLRLWATIVAGDPYGDLETARRIWSEIVHRLGERALIWTEYVTLERLYGDRKHLRKTFLRGMEKIRDFPEYFGDLWIRYELEIGDGIENLEKAETRIAGCLKINDERKMKLELSVKSEDGRNRKTRKNFRENQKSERKRDAEKAIVSKGIVEKEENGGSERKRKIGVVQRPEGILETEPKRPKTEKEIFKAPLPVKPPPGFKGVQVKKANDDDQVNLKDVKVTSDLKDREPQEKNTVFLSNLDYDMNEEQIRLVMSKNSNPPIVDVRLAKTFSGKSRGFAFVEFENPDDASSALLRDRKEKWNGRPIFISRCQDKDNPHPQSFKYSNTLEKNKLFVRGLNYRTTEQDIRTFFEPYGKLKDVRLVTFRNGKSKGLAFVEFEDHNVAAQALLKTDQTSLHDHVITVAISNPPPKKREEGEAAPAPTGGGGGGTVRKSRIFLPSSVIMKKNFSDSKNGGKTSSTEPKSNDDFRQLLLK